jgi:recombination associated protein RdgC
MLFKNIYAFTLNESELSENTIAEKLEKFRIQPIGKFEEKSVGWTDVLDEEDNLVFKVGKSDYILNLKTEEKSVPASVIGEELKKRIKEMVAGGDEFPNKKAQKVMKEEIKHDLLNRAFVKPSSINGYIDFKNKLLVVDASSPAKADKFNSFLRDTLGSLDLDLINPENDVSETMGSWLKDKKCPRPFEIGENCLFKERSGNSGKINVSNHDLTAEEIVHHLENDKIVDKLSIVWQKRISFAVNSAFRVTGVKFLDIVAEQIKEELGESEDKYAMMKAEMEIMVGDFAEIVQDLVKAFSEE